MRLFEEIVSRLGLEEEIAAGNKYVVFPEKCAYFENVKALRAFSSVLAEIVFKDGALRVEGEGLRVGYYNGGDLVLFGRVSKVEKTQ